MESPLPKILEADPSYKLINSAECGPASSLMTINYYSRDIADPYYYALLKRFADGIMYPANHDELTSVANMLCEDKAAAAEIMYQWIEATNTVNMSNEDYVALLSRIVLELPPDIAKDPYWIEELDNGRSRCDVLYWFIISK